MPKQESGRLTDRQRALADLAAAAALLAALDQLVRDAVGDALEAGATWQEVGDALGVTRSAAYQRFHR